MERQRRPTVRRRGGGPGCGVGHSDPARFACRALGPRPPHLRRHAPGVGDGHPQPHPGLVLRPGQLLRLRRLPPQGRGAGGRRGRRPRRGRRQGRPGAGGVRGRGAGAGGAGRRSPGGALRRAAVRSTRGAPACWPRRPRPARASATTSAASPTRTTCPWPPQLGASVVATHIRLAPRVPDPEPEYPDGLVPAVLAFLADRAATAEAAGIPPERIMVDAGLDLGKTEPQSLELLRASDRLAALGYPVFLSASNKRFLGEILGLEVGERGLASVAAHALGITLGCRVLRVHDVRGTRRTADVLAEVLAARAEAPEREAGAGAMSVHLLRGKDEAILGAAVSELVHELVGRRRPLADGRRVRRRRRTTSASWSTRPRPRRSSPSGASSSPGASSGSPPTTCGPLTGYLRRSAAPRTDLVLSAARARSPKHLLDAAEGRPAAIVRDTDPPARPPGTAAPGSTSSWRRVGVRLDAGGGRPRRRPAGRGRRPPAGAPRARSRPRSGRAASSRADDVEPFLGEAGARAAVGPHRRHRPGRHRRRARHAAPDAARRRPPPAAGDGDPARPLRADAAPRRGRRARPSRMRPALLGDQAPLPGPQGARPGPAGSATTAWRGPSSCWPRPTSTCGAQRAWPGELVMEVLVARLCRLAPPAGRPGAEPGGTGAVGARPEASTAPSGLGGGGVDRLHQAALAAGGLVLVDDALGGGLVEALLRQPQRPRRPRRCPLGRRDGALDAGLQLALDGLVALGAPSRW